MEKMEKKEDNLCIIIIPPARKVKRITIPLQLLKIAKLSITTLTLAIILLFSIIVISHKNLKNEYNAKVSEVNSLIEENKNKDIKIEQLESEATTLYEKSSEIQYKLQELENIKRQLEKIAGINSFSRGNSLSSKPQPKTLEDVQMLEQTLEEKEKEFEDFINQLEKRLEYLQTVPDLWPTTGRLTSTFGSRKDPISKNKKFHSGIDIANLRGTNVWAAARGKVVFSGYKSGYGKLIIIDHGNGYKTLYAHNSKLLVEVGDTVDKGQTIAKMGSTGRSTGSHLHFEIHYNDNPIDPLTILK